MRGAERDERVERQERARSHVVDVEHEQVDLGEPEPVLLDARAADLALDREVVRQLGLELIAGGEAPDVILAAHEGPVARARDKAADLARVREDRLELRDAEPLAEIDVARGLALEDRDRQREPLREHAAQLERATAKRPWPQELGPRGPVGEHAVDLEEHARIAGGEFALLDDDRPAHDAGLHDVVRTPDRGDRFDRLDRD